MNRPGTPITDAYDNAGDYCWVNRFSGDMITWCPQRRVYQFYRRATGSWSWWGPTREGTQAWHPYERSARASRVDFWIFTLIGLLVFVSGVSCGEPGAGALALGLFLFLGSLMSWLHAHRPSVHTTITLIGLVGIPLIHHASRHDQL